MKFELKRKENEVEMLEKQISEEKNYNEEFQDKEARLT